MARRIFRHTTSGPAFSTTIAGTETGMPLHADTPLPSAPTAVVVQALAQAAAVARAAAWSLAPTQEQLRRLGLDDAAADLSAQAVALELFAGHLDSLTEPPAETPDHD